MIKNIMYLDEYKMYSMSSQIFEGVTEYLVSEESLSTEKSEAQKGPVASGRLLADILKSTNRTSEKKYLHDYSYNLFEQHLTQENKVLVIDAENMDNLSNLPGNYSFIRAKARAFFNDIQVLKSTLERFNSIGSSLALVSNFEEFIEFKKNRSVAKKSSKNKGFTNNSTQELASAYFEFAKLKGLHHEPDFLDGLKLVLDYGFHDQLELQLEISNFIFSANLNRNYLREPEDLIIRKYSRRTEKEFIIFGIVTQSNSEGVEALESEEDQTESMSKPDSIKAAVII